MSAPQVIARALTFDFSQSVSTTTGLPNVLEIAVTPLDDGSSATAGATFAGGVQTATVELSSAINSVTFDLIPTYSPGLDAPINYRVMWKTGVMSRTYTYDFAMPDSDLTWDQLTSTIGNIIDGTSYLQQTDLGVPGRVAQLNSNGVPITSTGITVALSSDITAVDNTIAVETNAREAADSALASNFSAQLATQINANLATAQGYTDSQVSALNGDIANERGNRINADTDLQTQITTNLTTLNNDIASITAQTGTNTGALAAKADLVSGKVPLSELPTTSLITTAISVPNQTAMLALTSPTVHQGSIAVRPDGVFLLNATDPSQLANWVALDLITSVNGHQGEVTLTAADVNAVPVNGSIAQSQVTGLNTALAAKANQSDLVTAQNAITAIQSDTSLVHTVSGTIPTSLLSTQTVYLNSNGQLVNGSGTIIPISGGSGAVFSVNGKTGVVQLTATDVNAVSPSALTTALTTKADLVSGTVPLAELPSLPMTQITGLSTALTNTAQLTGGLIALSNIPTLPQSQITGLSALISGNELTSSTNAINRIATLESQIATVGSGGGGGGLSTQVPFYTSSNTTTAVLQSNFTSQVNLHSPWGIDSDGTITGTVGAWYYLYTGVRSTDVAYPFISTNGHLQLHKWNESGPADPVYALQSDLTTANTQIAAKANQTDLLSLTNTVSTKANASDLAATNAVVDTLATTSSVTALSTQISGLATQSALATTNATVATLATQASVTALTSTVGTKANQSDMTTAQNNISTINAALPAKADLVGGVLKASEIPTGIPQANVTGLTTALANAATLSGANNTVPLNQMPQNIPQSYVSGLGTTLGAKADLVGGTVPLSQLPQGALPDIQVVANQAAMLALTTSQVQYGSFAIITGTSAQGTYVLTGSNPAQLGSWTEFTTPQAPVTSVNTLTGDVVVTPALIGALAANASIPQTQVTGLSTALASIPSTYAPLSQVNALPTFSNVQTMLSNSSFTKRADYATTTQIATLQNSQSADGVLMPAGVGAIVLLASQTGNPVNNGLWVVNTGPWTRPPDYATGSYISKDTVVIVNNQTTSAGGASFNNTIWQQTANSGFIDSSTTAWTRIGYTAPPFTPVGGNGVSVSGSTFTAVAAPTIPNTSGGTALPGGIQVLSTGLALDPNAGVRKYVATGLAPSGSPPTLTVNHNLNSYNPTVSIWQTGSNTLVLAGIQATTANTVSIELNSNSGTYNVTVMA